MARGKKYLKKEDFNRFLESINCKFNQIDVNDLYRQYDNSGS